MSFSSFITKNKLPGLNKHTKRIIWRELVQTVLDMIQILRGGLRKGLWSQQYPTLTILSKSDLTVLVVEELEVMIERKVPNNPRNEIVSAEPNPKRKWMIILNNLKLTLD